MQKGCAKGGMRCPARCRCVCVGWGVCGGGGGCVRACVRDSVKSGSRWTIMRVRFWCRGPPQPQLHPQSGPA